jgi:hypothetical protein
MAHGVCRLISLPKPEAGQVLFTLSFIHLTYCFKWCARKDSNLRPPSS